jgi:nucleotide-binding universal stress UspA family protein
MKIIVRNIVCPVDTSEFSRRALGHAVALGKWYGAEVTAVAVRPTILPPPLWTEYPVTVPYYPSEHGERAAEAVRTFVRDVGGTESVRVELTEGFIVSEILRIAMARHADLIVMGTHGLSGFNRFLLGSVTEEVLRQASCPVLTVPRQVEGGSPEVTYKTIVCGVDFSPSSERAIDYALSLAQEAGGRIVLVHALESLPEEDSKLSAHFNIPEYRRAVENEARAGLEGLVPPEVRNWCDTEPVLGHGRAYRELLRVAEDRGADLIVLGVRGHSAAELALFGSNTQHVLRQARCPVLTVPPAE